MDFHYCQGSTRSKGHKTWSGKWKWHFSGRSVTLSGRDYLGERELCQNSVSKPNQAAATTVSVDQPISILILLVSLSVPPPAGLNRSEI